MADSNSRTVYLEDKHPFTSVVVPPPEVVPEPTPEDLWKWLPPLRLRRIAEQAYRAAQQSCLPPPGKPFVQDGQAYADIDGFVDTLMQEFENLIRLRLGTSSTVSPQRLERFHSLPQDAMRAAFGAMWRRVPKSGGRA